MEVMESFQAVSQNIPDVSESGEINNDINIITNATAANPSGFESSKNFKEQPKPKPKPRPKNKHEPITKEDMEYINTHSAVEIAKHFNRSTTWAYSRMNGTKTTY